MVIRLDCSLVDCLVALPGLILVLHDVLLLQGSHALDFVQVHNEALVIAVQQFNALATENGQVVGAVEVLHSLRVLLAKLLAETLVILIFKAEGCLGKDGVFLHNFVQDVDVEGQTLCTFELLDQLAADGAAHAVLVVQLLNAVGAQGVAAVHQYARNALAHVVLEGAKLADVETTRLVVEVHDLVAHVHLD